MAVIGGGGQSSRSSAAVEVPPEVRQLMQTAVPHVQGLMNQLPLESFAGANVSGVAPLTGMQNYAVGTIGNQLTQAPLLSSPEQQMLNTAWQATQGLTGRMGAPLLSSPETTALQQMMGQVSAPIGQSPATLEAIKNWRNTAMPTIQNEMGLAGLGRSGALGSAIGQSESQLLAPLYQTEIENRNRAVQGLLGIGQTMEARPGERAAAAEAAGQPLMTIGDILERRPTARAQAAFGAEEPGRQITQQQFDAQQQDFLRRQALAEEQTGVVTGSIMPSTFGQRQRADVRGGGLWGSLFGGSAKTILIPLFLPALFTLVG